MAGLTCWSSSWRILSSTVPVSSVGDRDDRFGQRVGLRHRRPGYRRRRTTHVVTPAKRTAKRIRPMAIRASESPPDGDDAEEPAGDPAAAITSELAGTYGPSVNTAAPWSPMSFTPAAISHWPPSG